MTIEKMLKEFGVRLMNTKTDFVEENNEEIKEILFINSATEAIFKIFVSEGYKEIEIVKKKQGLVSLANNSLQLLFAVNNWVMVADNKKDTLMLCKI